MPSMAHLAQFGKKLEKIYRYLLQLLALPLTPHASHGLIEKQIHEICGRQRRYGGSWRVRLEGNAAGDILVP